MKINYQEGDLFKAVLAAEDKQSIVIAHVCNDKGGFGSGFVVPLARHFPIVRESYLNWHETGVHKLQPDTDPNLWDGNTEVPFEIGEVQLVKTENGPIVANMIAQTLGGIRPLYYNHLARCMDLVSAYVQLTHARIVSPMFGSALAGGNWFFIEQLINDCWLRDGIDVTIHYLPGQTPEDWTPLK